MGQFMCPNGIRRTFSPKRWEHGTPVLVFGELLALVTAIAAVPITLLTESPYGQWLLYAAAIIGAGALFWYALDKSTLGEMPLTGTSARRIAAVINLKKVEETIGPVVNWDTISGDGTRATYDMAKMKPEIKQNIFEHTVATKLEQSLPEVTRQQIIQQIRSLPESDRQELIDNFIRSKQPRWLIAADSEPSNASRD